MKIFQRQPDCPDLDALLAASPESHAGRHLRTCPFCQNEIAMFRSFQSAEARPEEVADVGYVLDRLKPGTAPRRAEEAPTLWQRFSQWWNPVWAGGFVAAAAAVVLFLSLSGQLRVQQTVPSPAGESTWRADTLRITTPVGDLDAAPGEIAWTAVPGAANYAVSLAEIDGTRVFYKKVTNSALASDSDVATLLRSGKVYLLSITAEDASGKAIAEVGPERIRVKGSKNQ